MVRPPDGRCWADGARTQPAMPVGSAGAENGGKVRVHRFDQLDGFAALTTTLSEKRSPLSIPSDNLCQLITGRPGNPPLFV